MTKGKMKEGKLKKADLDQIQASQEEIKDTDGREGIKNGKRNPWN